MNYCQHTVFLGFIGPNIILKIIQSMSKIWNKVYKDRVIALVHELIVIWQNHCASGLTVPKLIRELVR